MVFVRECVEQVRKTAEAACLKAERNPKDLRIVAISKGIDPGRIREVFNAGISDMGENYLQEFLLKKDLLKDLPIIWHFTGHVQTNKAEDIAGYFSFIHSLDSLKLAETFNEIAEKKKNKIPVLIQVKIGRETGYGFLVPELLNSIHQLKKMEGLELRGLMMMAPPVSNPDLARPYFKRMKELFLQLKPFFGDSFSEISMGMSSDFSAAIEEGATIIRIGKAIFGEKVPIKK